MVRHKHDLVSVSGRRQLRRCSYFFVGLESLASCLLVVDRFNDVASVCGSTATRTEIVEILRRLEIHVCLLSGEV